jgi:hypothetical protein
VTGGDDNAIHLTRVMIEQENTCKPIAAVLEAHTSTVTGVLSLGNSKFLSVGIDQKIRMWKVSGDGLTCLYESYTFVPDVGGFIEIGVKGRKRQFVIFGTGIELIELDSSMIDSTE